MKLIILFLLLTISGCQSTGKYSAPKDIEDCINLAQYDVSTGDTSFRCGCIDNSITKDNFNDLFDKVKKQMSNHPEAEYMLDYLEINREAIIKSKEYILHGWYCRGYSSTSARDREKLENWAEENRVERIKCEKRKR